MKVSDELFGALYLFVLIVAWFLMVKFLFMFSTTVLQQVVVILGMISLLILAGGFTFVLVSILFIGLRKALRKIEKE